MNQNEHSIRKRDAIKYHGLFPGPGKQYNLKGKPISQLTTVFAVCVYFLLHSFFLLFENIKIEHFQVPVIFHFKVAVAK